MKILRHILSYRVQETLYQTAHAGASPSDSGCRRHSIRQQMERLLYPLSNRSLLLPLSDEDTPAFTVRCRVSCICCLIECRRHSIRQWMQETPYQTADAGVSPSDSGCRRLSIRQRMQDILYQTADARVSPSDSGCRSISIRQRMQECLLHPLSDGENTASTL